MHYYRNYMIPYDEHKYQQVYHLNLREPGTRYCYVSCVIRAWREKVCWEVGAISRTADTLSDAHLRHIAVTELFTESHQSVEINTPPPVICVC